MKKPEIGATALVGVVLVLSVTACGHMMMGGMKEDGAKSKVEMAATVKVTIEQAIKAASEKVPGMVIEAELEEKQGKTAWDVEVVTVDGAVMEVIVDAETGAVTSIEKKKLKMNGCC